VAEQATKADEIALILEQAIDVSDMASAAATLALTEQLCAIAAV
jgi:hypothetical protein